MAVSPVSLSDQSWLLSNTIVVPVLTEDIVTQKATLRAFICFGIPFVLLIDALKKDIWEGRSLGQDQAIVYTVLADHLSGKFGIDGKSCLLRFICELQGRPLANLTVIGELLSVLFNPEKEDNKLLRDYLVAKKLGRTDGVVCSYHYTECSIGVFDYFESLGNVTVS